MRVQEMVTYARVFCVPNRVLFVLLVLSLSPRLINDFASKGLVYVHRAHFYALDQTGLLHTIV